MDASDTRRGRPATHRTFESEHRAVGWRGDPEQYGAAAAILLGDLLLSWSDELLLRCGLPADRVAAALDVFDLCRSEVITGQFLDVSAQARGRADVNAAMTVLRYKSAKYSIERPLHLGAALAGASEQTLAELTAFGLPLGEAFQLRDDLLGVFGDPDTTGKPAGDDLVEGKRTVLVALALDAAPAGDAAMLDSSLGTALSDDQVQRLRDVITDSGAARPGRAGHRRPGHPRPRRARPRRHRRRCARRTPRPRDRGHPAGGLRPPAQSSDGTSTSGPSPRSSAANGGLDAARFPSRSTILLNVSSSARASGPQPSQSRTVGSEMPSRHSESASRSVPCSGRCSPSQIASWNSSADSVPQPSTYPNSQPACSTVCWMSWS